MVNSAMKLFMLRHSRGGAIVRRKNGKAFYFNDKMVAKSNKRNGQVVSFGPDHKLFKHDKEVS